MSGTHVPSGIQNAPATARLVYTALDDAHSLTIAEIEERTGSCTRSVKEALGRLRNSGFVKREPHPTDQRRALYATVDASGASQSAEEVTTS
ncbi:MarR family transcriptional regulator [Halorientalis regularis]|uniref:MarR family protein n=1 Tax=Halorientalis regularis TaxID=660518 RepID=A0A1G7UDK4_9EURY|nr:helix-turn-helix domain-containing protein [Halorientalis regularis]SDG45554.1 hypothetical protein SAMN05216218_1511 [Halorientalis regularis]